MKILAPILAVLLLTACQSKPRGPVPIERDDACASCRMAISERRYAAEAIDQDGNIYKFDDIACMLRFAHARGFQPSKANFYVTDYATGKDWVDARHAHFMKLRTAYPALWPADWLPSSPRTTPHNRQAQSRNACSPSTSFGLKTSTS